MYYCVKERSKLERKCFACCRTFKALDISLAYAKALFHWKSLVMKYTITQITKFTLEMKIDDLKPGAYCDDP